MYKRIHTVSNNTKLYLNQQYKNIHMYCTELYCTNLLEHHQSAANEFI